MDFRKNKYFLGYLATWGILLIAGSLMSTEVEPRNLVIITGLLSLVTPLLYLVCNKVGANAPVGKTYTVFRMDDPAPVCRVEGPWIYRGTEDKATWYVRSKKVYAFAEKKYLYRIEGDQIYRRGESEPCMFIRNDTVYSLPDSTPIYQTVGQEDK